MSKAPGAPKGIKDNPRSLFIQKVYYTERPLSTGVKRVWDQPLKTGGPTKLPSSACIQATLEILLYVTGLAQTVGQALDTKMQLKIELVAELVKASPKLKLTEEQKSAVGLDNPNNAKFTQFFKLATMCRASHESLQLLEGQAAEWKRPLKLKQLLPDFTTMASQLWNRPLKELLPEISTSQLEEKFEGWDRPLNQLLTQMQQMYTESKSAVDRKTSNAEGDFTGAPKPLVQGWSQQLTYDNFLPILTNLSPTLKTYCQQLNQVLARLPPSFNGVKEASLEDLVWISNN